MYEDDEDEFAPLGTGFAPLEADEIVSRKPEIDQTVRDERGRRRFHGAFTGGFSAGYWNTVGSAEGFTPQIFSSSRVKKYDHQKTAKPEDYMDDEDFGSFGIAPKRIHTKDDFTENVFAGLRDTSLTFDDVIKSVFAPAKESIGMRLFRKMKRHIKMEQKDRHRDLFLMADHDQSSSRKSKETLQYETKGDLHGLGYSGMLDPNNFLYGDPTKALAKPESVSATLAGGRKLKISGEAFGYGALEDNDDDLMGTVYSKDDMSQYDFAIGGAAPRQKPKQKRAGPYGKLSGNTLELEGFDKATKATSLFNDMRKNYRLPELPRNWRPKRRGKAEQTPKRSRWDKSAEATNPSESVAVSEPKLQPTLNANLRAVILGEEVVHKMGIAKSKAEQPKTPKESEATELAFDKVLHPPLAKPQVQKALSGFLASRFTHGSSALDDPSISAGLSTFKDLTSTPGFDSSQRKSSEEQGDTAEEKKPTRTTYEWHPHKLLCKRFGLQNPYPLLTDVVGIVFINRDGQKMRNMTSTIQNVKGSNSRTLFAGLFGNLGELGSFNPVVSEKAASSFTPGKPKTDTPERENQATTFKTPAAETTNRNQTRDLMVEDSDSEDEKEPEKSDRPPIDLFKSIFASDEEDSDGDEDDESDKRVESEPAKKPETKRSAVAENDSSGSDSKKARSANGGGSGIFAGVDFVQLNQNFNPCLKPKAPEEAKEKPQNVVQLDEDCYGPALPPPPSTRASLPTPSTSNSTKSMNSSSNKNYKSTAAVASDESDRRMRHKDKKRKKYKKKKSKKKNSSSSKSKKPSNERKRKRSSSDDSSSDSSGESGEDAQLVEIIRQHKYRRL